MARNRKRGRDRRSRPAEGARVGARVGLADGADGQNGTIGDPGNDVPAALRHSSPDTELADAQVAFGRPELAEVPDPSELEEFEEAEAAADAAAESDGPGEVAVRHPAHPERPISLVSRFVGFLRGSWAELQRVQWPDRRQVMQATGVVLGFVIVAGVFLGVADVISSKLVNLLIR